MVRILSTALLVALVVLSEVTQANLCSLYFKSEVKTVQDFKNVAQFALENHAYHGTLDRRVISHFVFELPKYMDSFKIIFEEADILKFTESDSKMVRRIETDLNQNKIKRMEVLYARYQMRIKSIQKELLESDAHKADIINKATSGADLEISGWGKSSQEVIENAKTFLAMQVRQVMNLNQTVEDAYTLSKRTLTRYIYQWQPKQSGTTPLIEIMSRSFVSGLDPFSKFKSREELLEDALAPDKKYLAGFAMIEGVHGVIVADVMANSAAEKAGMLKGDVITRVQGLKVREMSLNEFVSTLNEIDNPLVKFRISRSGQEFDVNVMRGSPQKRLIVQSKTVVSRQGQLVSIKLNDFDQGAAQVFLTGLNQAFKKGPVAGVILDLRGNPGGYVHEALQILRVFLSSQPVLVYQNKGQVDVKSLGGEHPTLNLPLIVLVNEGSASASELVSGALQAEKRAIVVGVRTFGKGTAHSVVENEYGGMQLTQDFFHFTNGESPQLKGVQPDIRVGKSEDGSRFAKDLNHALPEQKITPMDRSTFADQQRDQTFDSIRKVLIQRSQARQKLKAEPLDPTLDTEITEAFRILNDWAEMLNQLAPQVPAAS